MIGVLNAYHFDSDPNTYQKAYAPMCRDHLTSPFNEKDIRIYQIAFGDQPKNINECSVWFITGSPKSAYDNDPWILWLAEFIRQCHSQQKPLIGLCFGHQMIAHALGGRVEKAKQGWGVGVRQIRIINKKTWMQPTLEQAALLFSHQDQVTHLPPAAEHLAQSSFCQFEMFSIGQHILTMQGHPEFSVEFARSRYEARRNLLGEDLYKQAIASLSQPTDYKSIWSWIKNFSVAQK